MTIEPFKLKMSVGGNVFEAEGTEDAVKAQLAVWKDLIKDQPPAAPPPVTPPTLGSGAVIARPPINLPPVTDIDWTKLYKKNGDVLTLNARPTSGDKPVITALFITLLGYHKVMEQAEVPSDRLMETLANVGFPVDRVDRLLKPFEDSGFIIRNGAKKGTKYKLSLPGLAEAESNARQLIATIP